MVVFLLIAVLLVLTALLLLLVLVFVLILVVAAATAAVFVVVDQTLGVGIVVFGLLIRGVQPQRLLVAFERFLVFLLLELRVSEVVEGLGALVVRAQRIGRRLPHGLLGLVEPFGLVERVSEVVTGLERFGCGLQSPLVTLDALFVIALVVLPVAAAHLAAFGHVLRRSAEGGKEKYDI